MVPDQAASFEALEAQRMTQGRGPGARCANHTRCGPARSDRCASRYLFMHYAAAQLNQLRAVVFHDITTDTKFGFVQKQAVLLCEEAV